MTDRQKKLNNMILAGVFLAYLSFNGILLMRHELWRDEANVWLLARELSPFQLLGELRYQGHPCLWYLMVMPFAKAGMPFQTIACISCMVMAVAGGVFLFKAPFARPVKALLLFSPMFTYFYAVVARNYCLIALLLILLAVCYPQKNEKCILYGLLLGLLVQSDIIALAAAGMISCMWLWENLFSCIQERSWAPFLKILRGIWIPLASFLLLVRQFYGVEDSPEFYVNYPGLAELTHGVRDYCLWIVERLTGKEQGFCILLLVFFLLLFLAGSGILRNFWPMCVMISAYLFEAVFSVIVYQLHIWHFIALCFVLIWSVWILYELKEEKKPEGWMSGSVLAGLQILTLVLAGCMFLQWNSEVESSGLDNALHGLYSDGVHTAEYIEKNIDPEELIVSANVSMASTVSAYLRDYEFYYAGNGKIETYADYSEAQNAQIDMEGLLFWVKENFPEQTVFYLLDSVGSCISDSESLEKYEILYKTEQKTARGEEYTLYRIEL